MSPTVVVPAMFYYRLQRRAGHAQVDLVGIDERTQSSVSDFGKYLAASGQPQTDEFRSSQRRLRRSRSPRGRRRAGAAADGGMPAGNIAARWPDAGRFKKVSAKANSHAAADRNRNAGHEAAASQEQPTNVSPRRPTSIPSPISRSRRKSGAIRSGQAAARRRRVGHRDGRLPHADNGEDQFLVVPGDDVKIDVSHVGAAAEDRRRQLHRRRFLRKQDERIRLEVRVRADPQVAGDARHDRPDSGRRKHQRHPDQAQARRRRRRRPRKDQQGISSGIVQRFDVARQARPACWTPSIWKRESSTFCCL